jgi:hypothetical protein
VAKETTGGKDKDPEVAADSKAKQPDEVAPNAGVTGAPGKAGDEGDAPGPTQGPAGSPGEAGNAQAEEVVDLTGQTGGSVAGSNPEGKGEGAGKKVVEADAKPIGVNGCTGDPDCIRADHLAGPMAHVYDPQQGIEI